MTFGRQRLISTEQEQGYLCLTNDTGPDFAEIFPVKGRQTETPAILAEVDALNFTMKPSFSPDGVYLAHPSRVNSLSDSVFIYARTGVNTWNTVQITLIADTDYQGDASVCSFNHQGTRLAIAGVYNGVGTEYGVTVTSVPQGIDTWDAQTTWDGFAGDQWAQEFAVVDQYIEQQGGSLTIADCAFSENDSYLAVVGFDGGTPQQRLWIIKLSDGTEITPATQPNNDAGSCSWGLNQTYLAIAAREDNTASSNRVMIYKNTATDTWTLLTGLLPLTSNVALSVQFDPTATYLAVGLQSSYLSSTLHIYKRTGDTFSLVSAPASVPTNPVSDIKWYETGNYLLVSVDSTNSILYQRKGDTFTQARTFGDSRGCAVYPRAKNTR